MIFWSVVLDALAIGCAVQAARTWRHNRRRRRAEQIARDYAPPRPSA